PAHYDCVPYQSTHNTGGAVMGADPATSVVNNYLQHWDAPNVFVVGACNFPQNAGFNPTGTVGALAYRAAEGILKFHKTGQMLARGHTPIPTTTRESGSRSGAPPWSPTPRTRRRCAAIPPCGTTTTSSPSATR